MSDVEIGGIATTVSAGVTVQPINVTDDEDDVQFSPSKKGQGQAGAEDDDPDMALIVGGNKDVEYTYDSMDDHELVLEPPIRQYKETHDMQKDPRKLLLCFSGGGVRSAFFQAGVLKGLKSVYGTLGHVRAVSTVSGGGYVGSAWSSFVTRVRLENQNTIQSSKSACPMDTGFERFYTKIKKEIPTNHVTPTLLVILVLNCMFGGFAAMTLAFYFYDTFANIANVSLEDKIADTRWTEGECTNVSFWKLSDVTEELSRLQIFLCYLPQTPMFWASVWISIGLLGIAVALLSAIYCVRNYGAYWRKVMPASTYEEQGSWVNLLVDVSLDIARFFIVIIVASWLLFVMDMAKYNIDALPLNIQYFVTGNYGLFAIVVLVNVYSVGSFFGLLPKVITRGVGARVVEIVLLALFFIQVALGVPYLMQFFPGGVFGKHVVVLSFVCYLMLFEPLVFHMMNNYFSENLRRSFYCDPQTVEERYLSSQARFSRNPSKFGWGFDLLMNAVMHFKQGNRLFIMSQKKSYLLPKAGDAQIYRCETKVIETQQVKNESGCLEKIPHYPQMHHLMGISGTAAVMADYQKSAGFVYRMIVWLSNLGVGRWINFRPFNDSNCGDIVNTIPFFLREALQWIIELGILGVALAFNAVPLWSAAYYFIYVIFLPVYKQIYFSIRGNDAPAPFLFDFLQSSFFWRHIALIFNRNEPWRAYRAYITDGANYDNGGLMAMLHYVKIKKLRDVTVLCFDGTEDPKLTEDALIKSLENAQSPEFRIIKSFKLHQCPIGIQVQGNDYWRVSTPPGPLPQDKIDQLNKERVLRISVEMGVGWSIDVFVGKLLVLGTEYNKNIGLFASQKDGFPYTVVSNQGFPWGLAQRYRVLGKEIGIQVAKRDIDEIRRHKVTVQQEEKS
jgi:hypothetical protein